MNCREFEAAWNHRLDARDAQPASGSPLDAHAATCAPCRQLDARYQALERALGRLRVATPNAGFTERVLAALAVPAEPRVFRLPALSRLAAAAALLAAVGIGVWTWTATGRKTAAPSWVEGARRPSADAGSGDLAAALASATSATLDLARDASAPAARVGRQVLTDTETPAASDALALPEAVSEVELAEMWRAVGERVNEGVRPLGGTARHAFGFLLGTAADVPAPPAPAPKRGA